MNYGKQANKKLADEVARAREDKQRVRHLSIERALEWAYGDQRVLASEDVLRDEEMFLGYGSSDAGLEYLAALGVRIGGGGKSLVVAHPDALTIHRTVSQWAQTSELAGSAAGFLVMHARAGTRPEKPIEYKFIEPMLDEQGRVVVSYWAMDQWDIKPREDARSGRPAAIYLNSDRFNHPTGQACEVRIRRQSDEIEWYARDEYDVWVEGLQAIHSRLPELQTLKLVNFQQPEYDRAASRQQHMREVA